MLKAEQPFASRLARLLGATANDPTGDLRPAVTSMEPYAPQLQLSAQQPAEAAMTEPNTALPVRADSGAKNVRTAARADTDRLAAGGTERGDTAIVPVNANHLISHDPVTPDLTTPERMMPTGQLEGEITQDRPRQERTVSLRENLDVVESASPEVSVAGFPEHIDATAAFSRFAHWQQQNPSVEPALASPEVAQDSQVKSEKITAPAALSQPEAPRGQSERYRSLVIRPEVLVDSVQKASPLTTDTQSGRDEPQIKPVRLAEKQAAAPVVVAPAAVIPARVTSAQMQPIMPSQETSESASSRHAKTAMRERPALASVKIEIGEIFISVRASDTHPKRSISPALRRPPRAHAIPLSGFGEE